MSAPSPRTWFITGTSTGFGRQLTEILLARGEVVAATARDIATLSGLKARYGNSLWAAELDVTQTDAVRRVIGQAFADLGRIDVIVSNAGYGLFGAAEELSDDQILRQIDTNLIGSIQVARAALPHLRAQGGGRIVQLSSAGGQIAFPGLSLYHATKWGIEGFFEALTQEVAPFGIQTTLVEPGGARTDFGGRSIDAAVPLDAYEATPVGHFRRILSDIEGNLSMIPGDPVKIAQAIIASVDAPQAPRRLTLGSDAYGMVSAALADRLAALEAQKDLALSTDAA